MSKTAISIRKKKKPRLPSGWATSDADEVERRRRRAATESFQIESLTPKEEFFSLYQVESKDEQHYRVEIRSLTEQCNTCNCPDHRINGLGTCKHVEATLIQLGYKRERAFKAAAEIGSPYIESYFDRQNQQVRIAWPGDGLRQSKARNLLAPFFTEQNILAGEPLELLPAMQRKIEAMHPVSRRKIRLSEELNVWLELLDSRA